MASYTYTFDIRKPDDLLVLGRLATEQSKQTLVISRQGFFNPTVTFYSPETPVVSSIDSLVCDNLKHNLRLVYSKQLISMQHKLNAPVMSVCFTGHSANEQHRRDIWLHAITYEGLSVILRQPYLYRDGAVAFEQLAIFGGPAW